MTSTGHQGATIAAQNGLPSGSYAGAASGSVADLHRQMFLWDMMMQHQALANTLAGLSQIGEFAGKMYGRKHAADFQGYGGGRVGVHPGLFGLASPGSGTAGQPMDAANGYPQPAPMHPLMALHMLLNQRAPAASGYAQGPYGGSGVSQADQDAYNQLSQSWGGQ